VKQTLTMLLLCLLFPHRNSWSTFSFSKILKGLSQKALTAIEKRQCFICFLITIGEGIERGCRWSSATSFYLKDIKTACIYNMKHKQNKDKFLVKDGKEPMMVGLYKAIAGCGISVHKKEFLVTDTW
jgi:hypothetical protein